VSTYEHEKGVQRLEQAEREEGRLIKRYEAANGTGREVSAGTELRGAREDVRARSRWLGWVESSGQGPGRRQPAIEELRAI
jgi:hypothetical protein